MKKNISLVTNGFEKDAPLNDNQIESINNSLLSYSRQWNREFINLNRAGENLVNESKTLNAQTSQFNNYISQMYADLTGLINAIKYNGGQR